jgi:hypothetical protein
MGRPYRGILFILAQADRQGARAPDAGNGHRPRHAGHPDQNGAHGIRRDKRVSRSRSTELPDVPCTDFGVSIEQGSIPAQIIQPTHEERGAAMLDPDRMANTETRRPATTRPVPGARPWVAPISGAEKSHLLEFYQEYVERPNFTELGLNNSTPRPTL